MNEYKNALVHFLRNTLFPEIFLETLDAVFVDIFSRVCWKSKHWTHAEFGTKKWKMNIFLCRFFSIPMKDQSSRIR
jgi:hypothetical protein